LEDLKKSTFHRTRSWIISRCERWKDRWRGSM